MTMQLFTRRFTGVSILALVLGAATGCTSSQDRTRMEQAAQDNVALKAQLADMTTEHDTLKKDLAGLTKERDQYKSQTESLKADLTAQADKLRAEQKANIERAIQFQTSQELARKKLDEASKAQADAEQTAVKLKAAEDGVTAARAKAADSDRAAANAAAEAASAKTQAAQLASDKAALQQKLDALAADAAKKPDAPKVPAPK